MRTSVQTLLRHGGRLALPLLAAVAVAGPAAAQVQAAGRRITADEIRDIARREMLWCESFDADGQDCETITLLRLLPDGRVAETSTRLLQTEPKLQVFIADSGAISGDRVCSQIDSGTTGLSFTMDGRVLPTSESLGLRLMFMALMTEYEGKTLCQAFTWGDEPNEVIEEITLDGERRPELESTYMLRDGDAGLNLRAGDSQDGSATVHL